MPVKMQPVKGTAGQLMRWESSPFRKGRSLICAVMISSSGVIELGNGCQQYQDFAPPNARCHRGPFAHLAVELSDAILLSRLLSC